MGGERRKGEAYEKGTREGAFNPEGQRIHA